MTWGKYHDFVVAFYTCEAIASGQPFVYDNDTWLGVEYCDALIKGLEMDVYRSERFYGHTHPFFHYTTV